MLFVYLMIAGFVRIREVDDTEELKIQLMSDDKREYILSSNQKIISLRLSRLLSSSWTLFMLFRFENDFCEEKKMKTLSEHYFELGFIYTPQKKYDK